MNNIMYFPESQESGRPMKCVRDVSAWEYVCIALLVIVGLMNPSFVRAQTSYGSVVGTVTDSAGALVAGTEVRLTNKQTNAEQTAVTSSAGTYTFINLNPGSYSVSASHSGFNLQPPIRWMFRSEEQRAQTWRCK